MAESTAKEFVIASPTQADDFKRFMKFAHERAEEAAPHGDIPLPGGSSPGTPVEKQLQPPTIEEKVDTL